jgi:hypothetical protein
VLANLLDGGGEPGRELRERVGVFVRCHAGASEK